MKLSALAPFALIAGMATPQATAAQDTHAGRVNAIYEHYFALKAMANTEGYWQVMRQIRQSNAPLQGPVARANLFMNEIAEGTYDGNVRAMAELTRCGGHDVAEVLDIVDMGHPYLINLRDRARRAATSVDNVTRQGNIAIQRDCGTVFDRRIP